MPTTNEASHDHNNSKDHANDSNVSVDLTERSLLPSRDHVFLTWHDLDFIVPNIKGKESETLVDLDDPRAELISRHTLRMSTNQSGLETSAKGGAPGINLSARTSEMGSHYDSS
jgi:hypothetical protein